MPYTWANGMQAQIREKEWGNKFGPMVLNTMAFGFQTRQTGVADLFIQMGMYIKVIG